MEGVIEANINFTNNKATIVWADDVVKLSQIIDMIRAIGYNAYPYDASIQEAHANKERKEYYLRMAVALFATMNIMWIAVAQYAGYFTGITQDVKTILNIAEWTLATPVLFYSGWVFFSRCLLWHEKQSGQYGSPCRHGSHLDLFVFDLYYVCTSGRGVCRFGQYDRNLCLDRQIPGGLEQKKRRRYSGCDLKTDTRRGECRTRGKSGLAKTLRRCAQAISSSYLRVRRCSLMGEILQGEGSFDESNLTGENEPIYKGVGDTIISGTTSIDADVRFRASKDFAHSTLATLVNLLESALNKKPKIEQMANRLSEHFSSVILGLALVTFLVWWIWPHSFETAFMVGISVIIIACPLCFGIGNPPCDLGGIEFGGFKRYLV